MERRPTANQTIGPMSGNIGVTRIQSVFSKLVAADEAMLTTAPMNRAMPASTAIRIRTCQPETTMPPACPTRRRNSRVGPDSAASPREIRGDVRERPEHAAHRRAGERIGTRQHVDVAY